jgi:hypothetical protein
VVWGVIGGLIAEILLWSIIPGAIARRLPTSWHVSEWMAARVMGVHQETAAQRPARTIDAKKPVF